MAMTSEAKRALSQTVRKLRARLLDELGEATERAYHLSIPADKAALGETARIRRARLEGWIAEQVRALPAKSRPGAAARLLVDVVKDAAAILLQRLVYLRLLEAARLRPVPIVTGGWDSRGYKDFREAAPELVRPVAAGGVGDETEGYATLLGLVFDELALDLPGLYGPVRMTQLVPVPAATLRAVITALDDDALESVWTDDTTLGWIYQYWNDPEREVLDAKLAASKKLENHEIASKTQMFTERYMVEWLLHNSLGQMWLAMCRKHGWTADVERPDAGGSVLERLEARRVAWRARREAGEVALDALMPIEPGFEDRWKYWVPQPMPDDAVTHAPDSVRDLKLLDPACGSGHFLVIAFELLFFLYQEEARHRGEAGTEPWSDQAIVESILERNLHGIDIDPRAVQIAAAALMLKARQLCPDAEPRMLNLVAPNLSLASLADDDPVLRMLYVAVEHETGIPPALTGRIVAALAGADHLGTLLKVDAEIDAAIADWEAQLSQPVADQGELFSGFGPRRRKRITAEHARATLLSRLEDFLEHHTSGADLGLRLRGEQLAAGVRFVRLTRDRQYDIVICNPPYQGTSRLSDNYVSTRYELSGSDLYAAFIERGAGLARAWGSLAAVTRMGWCFVRQFEEFRDYMFSAHHLAVVADLRWAAFELMRHDTISMFVLSVNGRERNSNNPSVGLLISGVLERDESDVAVTAKRTGVLCQHGRRDFDIDTLRSIPGWPLVFWWDKDTMDSYRGTQTVADVSRMAIGLQTGDNVRFLRHPWEPCVGDIELSRTFSGVEATPRPWKPFIKGADGLRWMEPLSFVIRFPLVEQSAFMFSRSARYGRGESCYYREGVAYTTKGSEFAARAHRYASILGEEGKSVFGISRARLVSLLNSTKSKYIAASLNPTIHFTANDVGRLPNASFVNGEIIFSVLEQAFSVHEMHREASVEYRSPGASPWRYAQQWAQLAVDRLAGACTPRYIAECDPEPPSDHVSFAIGIALGRFDAEGAGILEVAPPIALPHGILFLSDASDHDSLEHGAAAPVVAAWEQHGPAIDDQRTLKAYLQDRFFPDVHRKMYENRPIYFPLSSENKSFVAYVSIHRWTASTLNDLLAEHLYPAKRRLDGEQTDLRPARDGADKKAAKTAEKRLGQIAAWLEELNDFIAKVEQCAEKGPPPPDSKTPPREVDARYEMDLDDGVMINSAALWPLLEPQWKDPKKWWKELASAEGKKDYDWAHLARRYFPSRVDAKCKGDPSLAVAHGCFWKYHPAKAYQWELRLQDEIRPDFTIDEVGSDTARAAFEAEQPEKVKELVAKEQQRRLRKQAKAGQAEQSEDGAQRSLDLADPEGDDEEANAEEELSA